MVSVPMIAQSPILFSFIDDLIDLTLPLPFSINGFNQVWIFIALGSEGPSNDPEARTNV